jgi:hypothetical protein
MAHLDEVIVRVDAAIAEGVITHMNELLIALSDDASSVVRNAIPSSSVCAPPLPIMGDSIRKSRTRAASS